MVVAASCIFGIVCADALVCGALCSAVSMLRCACGASCKSWHEGLLFDHNCFDFTTYLHDFMHSTMNKSVTKENTAASHHPSAACDTTNTTIHTFKSSFTILIPIAIASSLQVLPLFRHCCFQHFCLHEWHDCNTTRYVRQGLLDHWAAASSMIYMVRNTRIISRSDSSAPTAG